MQDPRKPNKFLDIQSAVKTYADIIKDKTPSPANPSCTFGYYADSLFQLGKCYQSGIDVPPNRKLAKECYNKATDLGHVETMNALGIFYYTYNLEKAESIEHNMELAQIWWERASVIGSLVAQYNETIMSNIISQRLTLTKGLYKQYKQKPLYIEPKVEVKKDLAGAVHTL